MDTPCKTITITALYCIVLALAAPMSTVYTEYVYDYELTVSNGPSTGFRFKAKASLDVLYSESTPAAMTTATQTTPSTSSLIRLKIANPIFYNNDNNEPLHIGSQFNTDYQLYAHVNTHANGTAYVKQIYTHQNDATTFKNIKKSILLNALPTSLHFRSLNQGDIKKLDDIIVHDDNSQQQPELFSPDSISQVNVIAKPKKSTTSSSTDQTTTNNIIVNNDGKPKLFMPFIFKSVEGYQNVTFKSRIFNQAESNLTTTFQLELVNELNSNAHEIYDNLDSIESAIDTLDKNEYKQDTIDLQRERRICSTHHCGRSLAQLFQDYRDSLQDKSLASVDAAVAFLRILERIRKSDGTGLNEINSVLKKTKGNPGVESSFLDILAAARTKDSLTAAFKHIKLPKNNNLAITERFLSVLSVAAKTASKMHLKRPLTSPYYETQGPALKLSDLAKQQVSQIASLEFTAKELLRILEQTPAKKWASHKLRWSTLLTLGTLVSANNQEHEHNVDEELNNKVSLLLFEELRSCPDADCRIVALQAIGNVGILGDTQFNILKEQVLNSGRRESISAMRVLRDLLQNQAKDKPLGQSFYNNLKDLLLRVVYDNVQETTARVLASEMIVRFVPNNVASDELLRHLPSFGNNELATMIYSRMQSLRPDSLGRDENWYWKSCIINGTSTSFVRTMARTDSLNASYGVNVELLNKGKLFKESSFDVFLDTKERTQDLFSLGIFARGLSGFASSGGGDDEPAGDENESTMAGMTLRLLGGYLRPYVFFTGTGELMSHIWSQTASEPTTAFNGNLLLIDHDEGYPLISGFVAEQQMRGVLSIDVSGKIKISWIWHRSSHSVVRTKASVIVQASQTVPTSFDNLFFSHLFSFGGEALIDFVADSEFSPMPVKTCLQVTQPEFIVRHNSRRHDQMMTNEVRRKITRFNYSIGAKSYSLNTENNKMCSIMNADEL